MSRNLFVTVLVRGARSELKWIYGRIQGDFTFFRGSNGPPDLEAVIQGLQEEDESPNYESFRLSSGTNPVLVALNPDWQAWREPQQHEAEIAAYWPLWMINPETGRIGLIAIRFGGHIEFLQDKPDWKPLSLVESR